MSDNELPVSGPNVSDPPRKIADLEIEMERKVRSQSGSVPSTDLILRHFEELVEAVLHRPPPSTPTSDPDWLRLFGWCYIHREFLAGHARRWTRLGKPGRVDIWLRELASPPNRTYQGVRNGAMYYIRLVGLPPRSDGEPMFTAAPKQA
jgi:hypothetical protein